MITCYFENNMKALGGLRHITVNVLLVDGNKILMGKRGTSYGKRLSEWGKWGLLGGYFGRDETLIQVAKREVLEESGCEIDNLTLFRINDNPNRPKEDKQNIDIIFIANLVKQTPEHDEEMTQLKWFPLERLPPPEETAFDHREDIELYKKFLRENYPLPLLG